MICKDYHHVVLYLLVLSSSLALAAVKNSSAKPPGPSPPGGFKLPADFTWTDLSPLEQRPLKLGSAAMNNFDAQDACIGLNNPFKNESDKSAWQIIFVDPDYDKARRDHIEKQLDPKGDVQCIWVSKWRENLQDGRKILVGDDGKDLFLSLYEEEKHGAAKLINATSAPNATARPTTTKKTKRQTTKDGIKLITMVSTQTYFPFIEGLSNSTDESCAPKSCLPMNCTIERKPDDCTIAKKDCMVSTQPHCKLLHKQEHKSCTGGCDNCTIESVHCFVRTHSCIATRAACNITSPNCTVVNQKCSVYRPPCVSYSKECALKPPTGKECIGESACVRSTGEQKCTAAPELACLLLNGNDSSACPSVFNCSLDPTCISPILCRPPKMICPPMETFCPPPIIKCPTPNVTCDRPIVRCPDPKVVCPNPDVVCQKPKVTCGAPVVKCSQVVATCGNPEVNCPAPAVNCANPRISCADNTVQNCPYAGFFEHIPRCGAKICKDCDCIRLERKRAWGIDYCNCQNIQCHPLCHG